MLIPAATLASRALRKRRPLLVVPVAVIAEAAAIVRAAAARKVGVMLEINALEPLAYDLNSFLSSLLMLVRENDHAEVAVGVRVAATDAAIQQALDGGAQFVRIDARHTTPAQYEAVVSSGARLAVAHGAVVIFTVAGLAHAADAARLARDHTVPFVTVPEGFLYEKDRLSAKLASDLKHALTSPVAMETDGALSPTDIRAAARAGLGALILTAETSQAFVAGARAALAHEREQSAARLVAKAATAVEERIDHYLEVLCTIS